MLAVIRQVHRHERRAQVLLFHVNGGAAARETLTFAELGTKYDYQEGL